MTILTARKDPLRAIGGVRPPDSRIAREAVELVRDVSSRVLFNHVMRSYLFGELLARAKSGNYDREIVLLSAVLHDLGLTDLVGGSRRFEIEGADAARAFVVAHGLCEEKAWLVWDNIALHTFDHNLYRQPEARAVQSGILADAVGLGIERLGKGAVAEILAAFPRLGFKRELFRLLRHEAETKPQGHIFHPSTMIAHHCLGGIHIPDARPMIDGAPFDE
ncbi:MAG: hypothetical protein ACREEP_10355 [Dongiaceae bacterium]